MLIKLMLLPFFDEDALISNSAIQKHFKHYYSQVYFVFIFSEPRAILLPFYLVRYWMIYRELWITYNILLRKAMLAFL